MTRHALFVLTLVVLVVLPRSDGPMTAAGQQRTRPQSPAPLEFFEVHERSILELQTAQVEGRVTSRGLVDAYLARVSAYDLTGPRLNAIVVLNPRAREEAEALDRERARTGPRGPLHGIPVLVKDNYDTVDMPTSGGALGLAMMQPAADAFQVKRLRSAGAVVLGKTTMHELAAGITTISSLTGQTRNPYDLLRVPGGSSGGTGAGVAASFAAAGMGSDTCGSIRIPAANQNLVGMRATRGLSSRTGVMPLSDTQDVAGPLARTVTDLAIMLDATVGADPDDTVTAEGSAHVPKSYRDTLTVGRLKGARIGVLRALFGAAPEDEEVGELMRKALDAMKTQGAEVIDVVVPGMDDLLRESSVIGDEFKFDLAAYLARHPNAPVKSLGEIIERGLHHDALDQSFRLRNAPEKRETEHYRQALLKRRALRVAVETALETQRVDVLAYPTLRRKPALIGEAQAGTNCQLSSTTGLPAISMPAGFTVDGLPVGLELLGPAFSEPALLGLAFAWEHAASPRRAPFSTPPLVKGAAPRPQAFVATAGNAQGPAARVAFVYDAPTGVLQCEVTTSGLGADRVVALTLQRSIGDAPGPIVAHHPVGWTGRRLVRAHDERTSAGGPCRRAPVCAPVHATGTAGGRTHQSGVALRAAVWTASSRRYGVTRLVRHGLDLWVHDVQRGTRSRLTSGTGSNILPVWSRDGTRIIFASNRGGNWDIHAQPADGSRPAEALLQRPHDQFPMSILTDGTLMYTEIAPKTGRDLWILSPDGKPSPLRLTPFNETQGQFSPGPDGAPRWVAFASDESGRSEIYVQSYPAGANRIPVSTAGGILPKWSRDGRELFYVTGDAVVTVAMQADASVGAPRRLFDRSNFLFNHRFHSYGVSPDGKRFLMIQRDPGSVPRQLNVILNWSDALDRPAADGRRDERGQ